ncbi:hypothetical protein EVAR_3638_1 [Eumeta japonica]|uniref:Uncharacterized protein n=1 Tax=Eumeta variegata TaxID=151549 RepID=A0A4C1SYR1_EUMVA|nr:hypothetical protein EVAR_3638_1 [Eumeta japonica]
MFYSGPAEPSRTARPERIAPRFTRRRHVDGRQINNSASPYGALRGRPASPPARLLDATGSLESEAAKDRHHQRDDNIRNRLTVLQEEQTAA